MSYLVIPNGIPDFGKAVISFWFRVQRATIDSVAQEEFTGTSPPRMWRIIPLLVFGKMYNGYELNSAPKGTATYTRTIKSFLNGVETTITTETHTYSRGPMYVKESSLDEDPSYIGIYCVRDEDTGHVDAMLRIRLQTPNFGSGSWAFSTKDVNISNHAMYSVADTTAPTAMAYQESLGICTTRADSGQPMLQTSTNIDQSIIFSQQHGPDSIEVGLGWAEDRSLLMEIAPDRWHHLLLSFDLMNWTMAKGATLFDAYTCSPSPARSLNEIRAISDPCKVWIALDDENCNGKKLDDPRFGTSAEPGRLVAGLGDNGVAPFYALLTTFSTSTGSSSNNWYLTGLRQVINDPMAAMPTYHYNPGALPSQDHTFGIPATSELVDRIRHVEMAEFQMWTDVTLDTTNVVNRRAFIDVNGKPVDPKGTESDPRGPGERLLGKKPEIILHGNSNWIKGYNTGTLGIDIASDGTVTKIPTGQFQPTGKIEKYKPEPALEETST